MYDSLGKYGILNVSAVTNVEDNIEAYGDIPTLCGSLHLIAVGSSTVSDNYASCGYSSTSVDLSAPGANIFSTQSLSKSTNIPVYRSGFSGTSFAAPMVTGAIALLNAYACDKFILLQKNDPERANFYLRKFILEGTDVLPSFFGKNASSGRLNIQKSLKLMDDFCHEELSLTELENKNISIFPNPGLGQFEIKGLETNSNFSIQIIDATGKTVDFDLNHQTVSLKNVSSGVYIVKIQINNNVSIHQYLVF